MTKSMTGFGLSSQTIGDYSISVEVKSLNSKFADINLRMSAQFSPKEIEWRKMIADELTRGKISVVIDVISESTEETLIDQEQFEKYFALYKKLGNPTNVDEQELFKLAIQAPGVFRSSNGQVLPDEIIENIPDVIKAAIKACNQFRVQEGTELESKLRDYLVSIKKQLSEIQLLDTNRSERVADRLKTALNNLELDVDVDKNRFEQELIYYIEKFDIAEEKVRLSNHLTYLDEVLSLNEPIGKKLGFVSQEIGREINTIGSKANDSDIQKHVVAMKEELEKIKEQSLNIL
jgi:uncharacterized protein (TIGR00255 family)